jgi:vancomycin resistance protein YoaR
MDKEDFEPTWPQRPDAEKAEPEDDTSPKADKPAPSSWTSHPTLHNLAGSNPAYPKATRAIPLVDGTSRFERPGAKGKGQERAARVTPPTAPPQQAAGIRPPRPSQPAPPNPRPQQPRQPRQEDYQSRGYEDPTLLYTPVTTPRASAPRQQAQLPAQKAYSPSKTKVDSNLNYLAVEVEGVRKRRWGVWFLWLIAGVIIVGLMGGTAFALAWQGQYSGKMYPGVSALGVDLGGKTQDEAKSLLLDKVASFTSSPVVLAWNGKEWKPSLDDLGVQLSVNETVADAYNVGRNSDFFGNIGDQWDSSQMGWQVPLTLQLSEPQLQSYLDGIADSEINQELFEGDVRLDGTTVEALPGKEGRTLDTYKAIGLIRDSLASMEAGTHIDLPVKVVEPTVSADEVKEVQDQLAIRISSPITATTIDKTFTLDSEALVNFTTIERNPDRSAAHHIELGWKDNELDILASNWVSDSNRPVRDARFAMQNGAVQVLTESIDGFKTDDATVIAAIKAHADKAEGRQFGMPGNVITPTVSSKDLPALGITDLMGTGTSTFVGSSPARATNIRVAANLLNGAVVPPGGTFSFLKTMGGITEAEGFVEGYVIAAERTQLGVGGGVCQVSTTMFRAAFMSGFEITERNPHAYRVSWYEANGEPVGFDAAVFDPGVDLKFVNNSSHYVLIEAIAGDSLLTVNVYGTKLAGEVKLEGPVISDRKSPPPDVYEVDTRLAPGTVKQVETAHAGLTTVITRRIITPGQADKVDQFNSTYQPWANWFIVASASQIPAGAQSAP